MREKIVKVFFQPVIYGIAVFTAELMMIAGSGDVLAANCDAISPAHLVIEIKKSEVQEFFDITSADLQRIAAVRGIQPHWPGLGVYSSDIAYAADIHETGEEGPDGSYCANLDTVHIVVALKNRVVHLARELKENHCLEEAQRQRLLQNAQNDARALEEFPVESEMRDLLAQLRPTRANALLAAKAQVTHSVRVKIGELLDKIGAY
jgi:hypothetical protein